MDKGVIDWRLGKFEAMGFEYMQCLQLVQMRDSAGVPIHHSVVQRVVERLGHPQAYLFLCDCLLD